jgi:hypothetical protein
METQIKKTYKKKPEHNNTPEYNKAYYEKNKEKIGKSLKARCVCEHCGREVAYQRLNTHKMTGVCLKNRKTSNMNLLSEEVARLVVRDADPVQYELLRQQNASFSTYLLTKLLEAKTLSDEKAV